MPNAISFCLIVMREQILGCQGYFYYMSETKEAFEEARTVYLNSAFSFRRMQIHKRLH